VEARRWARRLSGLDVRPWPEAASALAAVAAGEADMALVDAITARMALRDRVALRLTGEPVTYEPYAIVVPQRSQALLDVVNRTLGELMADGTLAEFFQRWL
jgi:ABC-type amino acid transport substrate-binding protein